MNIIQERISTFRITDRILDIIILFLAARISIILERLYHQKIWHGLDSESFNFYALIIIFIVWILLIKVIEYDLIYRITSIYKIFQNVFLITFIGTTSTITLDFLLQTDYFERSTIFFFSIVSFIFLFCKRGFIKYFLSYMRQEGMDPKNILVVGSKQRAQRLIKEFLNHQEYGFSIKGILDPSLKSKDELIAGTKVYKSMDQLKNLLKESSIDEVFFAMDLKLIPNVDKIFMYLDIVGVSYHIMINESVHNYLDYNSGLEPVASSYNGISMLSFHAISANYVALFVKNVIERVGATILIILSFPVLIIFGLIIKCNSKGPILFKQIRVGLRGRKFYQYKLRSMVSNAEELKEQYMHLNEQTGPVFKIKQDPRLTSVGKFMRKFSLDELPQLFNVIKGDMSLIGPRPLPVSEVDKFSTDSFHRRHSMKPGITGLWQVKGRNKIKDFSAWVKLDLEYIDNWSLLLDLKIAIKTISVVFSGSGI